MDYLGCCRRVQLSFSPLFLVKTPQPIIDAINVLVDKHWPPGPARKLYYLGNGLFSAGAWMLDGMTPVGPECVLSCLRAEGADVTAIVTALDEAHRVATAESEKREVLRASARAKLTPEEIAACNLTPGISWFTL